jgi:antitoxin (DNA-binding transcriptional repressor) of toxin-antitoxin stability system
MTITVDAKELPGRLAELVALVERGDEVIICDGGVSAKLVPPPPPAPVPAKREWVFNMHPGAMVMREDFDDPIDEEDFLKGNF